MWPKKSIEVGTPKIYIAEEKYISYNNEYE